MSGNGILNNLIDVAIEYENDPSMKGHGDLMFLKLLREHVFTDDNGQPRVMDNLVEEIIPPDFIKNAPSLMEIDREKLESFVNGETLTDSLAGRIMLSRTYLKLFYPHHPPSFNSLPEDLKQKVVSEIRERNECILGSFRKMVSDVEADKKRTVLSLVALALMNAHRRSGRDLKSLEGHAQDIIRGIIPAPEEIFRSTRPQMMNLLDEGRIRDLIKNFFVVRQFSDMTEITEIYRKEIERFRKRAERAFR